MKFKRQIYLVAHKSLLITTECMGRERKLLDRNSIEGEKCRNKEMKIIFISIAYLI